jgi:hypothetical protein
MSTSSSCRVVVPGFQVCPVMHVHSYILPSEERRFQVVLIGFSINDNPVSRQDCISSGIEQFEHEREPLIHSTHDNLTAELPTRVQDR